MTRIQSLQYAYGSHSAIFPPVASISWFFRWIFDKMYLEEAKNLDFFQFLNLTVHIPWYIILFQYAYFARTDLVLLQIQFS